MLRYLFAVSVAVACLAPVHATDTAHRHHGAHEHGTGRLNLAWEGNTVTIELESPAADIVGFEHRPHTDAQKKLVQDALTILRDADKLFAFTPEAGCRAQAAAVKTEVEKKGHDQEHSEFHANYHFRCEKADALRGVDVQLFKLFPRAKRLNAQIVSARGQSAAELNAGWARLNFR